jgi:hydrogenase/urease accessory protein HupE
LNGATAGRRALFVLPAAWSIGGLIGWAAGTPLVPAGITAASFLAIGALMALDRRLSPAKVASLALALGLVHGWLNGAALAAEQRDALGLVGITSAIFVVVTLGAALGTSVRVPWARLAVRVAGSWVAAIGLLMLGWSVRG